MRRSGIVTAVAAKRLAAVDLPGFGSNQHEINGVSALQRVFGTSDTTNADVRWIHLKEDTTPDHGDGTVTFYDSRASHPTRTEWRLYYSGTFLKDSVPGDLIWIVRLASGEVLIVVVESKSEWEAAAGALFGIHPDDDAPFTASVPRGSLGFGAEQLAIELGIAPEPYGDGLGDLIVDRFGTKLPTTAIFSAFARETAPVEPETPDEMLTIWFEHERRLFASFEHMLVHDRLRRGFVTDDTVDVDSFISFSLSVQNRRKSRAGHALENHLGEIFRRENLRFDCQATTERRQKPDFLFPGETEYHDSQFSDDRLRMLGAKTSCKERWRQILPEADRIAVKHLCTLDPGISHHQTDEMMRQNVVLVVPSVLHDMYLPDQRNQLLDLGTFIEEVHELQK